MTQCVMHIKFAWFKFSSLCADKNDAFRAIAAPDNRVEMPETDAQSSSKKTAVRFNRNKYTRLTNNWKKKQKTQGFMGKKKTNVHIWLSAVLQAQKA